MFVRKKLSGIAGAALLVAGGLAATVAPANALMPLELDQGYWFELFVHTTFGDAYWYYWAGVFGGN